MAQIPQGGQWTYVETALEMLENLSASMEWADVVIMAAAVCDMRPLVRHETKVEKSQLTTLEMQYNPDIIKLLAESFPDVHIVSFSLENSLDIARPLKKMRNKKPIGLFITNWKAWAQIEVSSV